MCIDVVFIFIVVVQQSKSIPQPIRVSAVEQPRSGIKRERDYVSGSDSDGDGESYTSFSDER